MVCQMNEINYILGFTKNEILHAVEIIVPVQETLNALIEVLDKAFEEKDRAIFYKKDDERFFESPKIIWSSDSNYALKN